MDSGSSDDYYALLGIDAHADDADLRRAWHRLALRWHPDQAGPLATPMFQKLSAAYAVLSDPTERAAYDRQRGVSVRSEAGASAPRRRAPSVLLQRLSGPLNSLLACGVARRAEEDVIELFVTAEEASQGGMVTISMRVLVRCPRCAADSTAACAHCGAQRTVEELFSAWLALPPEVAEGTVLAPSVLLRGMIRPVSFRVRFDSDT